MMKTIATLLLISACSAEDPSSSQFRATLNAVDASVDSELDAARDATPDAAPPPCGSLCNVGDSASMQMVMLRDPWTTFRVIDLDMDLTFQSIAGSARIEVDVYGNFGDVLTADGVDVSIAGGEPCPSDFRHDDLSLAHTACSAVVNVAAGSKTVPIHLHQWNGRVEAWSITTMTAKTTIDQ